jgi:hypothetical protein
MRVVKHNSTPRRNQAQMFDPLVVLPCELWTLCISFAIGGQQSGPLELLMVSTRWATLLVNSPSLWTQIYVQNGEDEMAQISAFLHLSKRYSLHVDIMTVLPTTASLQLIAENISRVATISIRPGASDNNTVFPIVQWKRVVSNILSILSNGRLPPDVEDNPCFGISFRENDQWHYRAILMQFTTAVTVTGNDEQNGIGSADLSDIVSCFRKWEEYMARFASILQYLFIRQSNTLYSMLKVHPHFCRSEFRHSNCIHSIDCKADFLL